MHSTAKLTAAQESVMGVLQRLGSSDVPELAALTNLRIGDLRDNLAYLEKESMIFVTNKDDLLKQTIMINPGFL